MDVGKDCKQQVENKPKAGNPNWEKGVSANPAGRPKGSKNRYTLLKEQILDAIEKVAKDGQIEDGITGWLAEVAKMDKVSFFKGAVSQIPKDTNLNIGGQADNPIAFAPVEIVMPGAKKAKKKAKDDS